MPPPSHDPPGAPPIIVPSEDRQKFTVRHYTNFLVPNARYQLRGTSLNVLHVERVPGGLVIGSIKERRLPDPPKPKTESKESPPPA